MKKIVCIALMALSLAACSRVVRYTSIPFVYFENPALSVFEDAGVIDIPVSAQAEGTFTVAFEAVDGTRRDALTGQTVPNGQQGEDYFIVDNPAAVLHFTEGVTTQNIQVSIKDFPGVLTGNKDFTVRLLSAGSQVSVGGFSSCKVTIIDNDHPLKTILGEYAATDNEGNSWTMTLVADPDNVYNVFIDGIVPTFAGSYTGKGLRHYVVATVSQDLNTITVPLGYKLADPYNDNDIVIFGYDGTYIYPSGTCYFTATEDGYALEGNRGFAAIYESGGSYYLAASDGLAMAPISFVKK